MYFSEEKNPPKILLHLVNLLDNSITVNNHAIRSVLEQHIPKKIPITGQIMFDLRLKGKYSTENLRNDCKHDEFVKVSKYNPKFLDMPEAGDEVMLEEPLNFSKIVW